MAMMEVEYEANFPRFSNNAGDTLLIVIQRGIFPEANIHYVEIGASYSFIL